MFERMDERRFNEGDIHYIDDMLLTLLAINREEAIAEIDTM